MNTTAQEETRPTVLLVEDTEYILRQREEEFRNCNFDTVVAENYQSALIRFRTTPGISLLATDINLDPNDEDNQDGLRLAEEIHTIMPELPMVALSGVVSEHTFRQSRKSALFKDALTKGAGWDKLRQRLPQWRVWATAYLQKRITAREEELRRLKGKYRISDYDFSLMREFIPLPVESGADVDALLLSKGYRLRIIETSGLPEECVQEGIKIMKAIPIWVHQTEGACIAEVYGYPQLYASGETEEAAIGSVLVLMHGFFQDFNSTADAEEGDHPLVVQLRHYLQSVFSPT